MKKPNLLFVITDQHRFCDLGFMGNNELITPNFDRIAKESAVFENAYSNCPVCVPARGTFFTGLHALKHGATANDMEIKPDCPSIARALNEAGYRTALIGKWHVGGIPREKFITRENRLGFTDWLGYECNHDYLNYFYDDENDNRHYVEGYEPVVQTDIALDYLKKHAHDEQPWAVFVGYSTPHPPYLVMPEDRKRNALKKAHSYTLRKNVEDYCCDEYVPEEGHWANDPRIGHPFHSPYQITDELYDIYAGYYAHIEALDEQMGRFDTFLKENGLYDDTVFAYTSDHGDMLGSHGMIDKQVYYQESAHIPFTVRWPEHIPAGRRKQPVSLVDMAPGMLGLLGIDYKCDGSDISPCMISENARVNECAYFYNYVPAHNAWRRKPEISCWRAVADDRYTFVTDEKGCVTALFDRLNDPYETKNIAGENNELTEKYRALLDDEVNKHDGFMPWQTLLYRHGLSEAWDKSQLHFSFPPIDEKYKN